MSWPAEVEELRFGTTWPDSARAWGLWFIFVRLVVVKRRQGRPQPVAPLLTVDTRGLDRLERKLARLERRLAQ